MFNVAEEGSYQSMESQTGKPTLNAGNSKRPRPISQSQLCMHDCGNVLANDAPDQCESIRPTGIDQLTAATQIGGFKSALSKVLKLINLILESGEVGGSKVRDLLSLRQAYESAHKRCVSAIEAYCGILIEGSPRYLEYSGRLATLKNERQLLSERIDQFLVNAVEVASSSRSRRSSRTQRSNVQSDVSAGGNSKVPVESVASKTVLPDPKFEKSQGES